MCVFSGLLITFYYQVSSTASSSKMVSGYTGITSSIWFSHIDDPEASIFRNGDSEIKANNPKMVTLSCITNLKLFLSFCHLLKYKSWLYLLTASSFFRIFVYIDKHNWDMWLVNFNTFLAKMVSTFYCNNYYKYSIGCSHSLSWAALTILCKGKLIINHH